MFLFLIARLLLFLLFLYFGPFRTAVQSSDLVNRFVQRFVQRKPIAAKQDTSDADWDHFVFSQQWPMSVCIDSHLTVGVEL